METIVKFHEGLRGSGVVVSVSYHNSRVIFDFGAPFRPATNVYDGTVLRRNKASLRDAIKLKHVPAIDGIFPQADLEGLSVIPYELSSINSAIVISHLHLDHMSNIGYVHPDVPVYMSVEAQRLQKSLDMVGEAIGNREFTGAPLYEPIQIGEITATPYFSDHPCYGSVGYLIKTPDSTIYYSGDIRFHGLQRERAFAELEKLCKENIDLLIIDGTTYSPSKFIHDAETIDEMNKPSQDYLPGQFSEAGIYEDVHKFLSSSEGVGIFNIYHRDMQLINALVDTAKSLGREIVFEPETAYIVYSLLGIKSLYYVPDVDGYEKDEEYLNIVKSNCKEISADEIKKNGKKYFVQCSYHNLLQMFSLTDPNVKGEYFHLFGEPFTKDGKANRSLNKVLEMCNLENHAYANLYSFNHAFPNHLCYVIEKLNSKAVVAVHSNVPEKLNPMNSVAYLPEQNVPYILKNGELIKK